MLQIHSKINKKQNCHMLHQFSNYFISNKKQMIITYERILANHFNHIVIFSQDIFKFDQILLISLFSLIIIKELLQSRRFSGIINWNIELTSIQIGYLIVFLSNFRRLIRYTKTLQSIKGLKDFKIDRCDKRQKGLKSMAQQFVFFSEIFNLFYLFVDNFTSLQLLNISISKQILMDWDMKGNRFWMASAILAVVANLFVLMRNIFGKIHKEDKIQQKKDNQANRYYLILVKNMLDTYLAYLFVTNKLVSNQIAIGLIGISIGCINIYTRK